MQQAKDIKTWVAKRALEIAKEEVAAEEKYQWELADEMARIRYISNPTEYMLLALIDYLEQL